MRHTCHRFDINLKKLDLMCFIIQTQQQKWGKHLVVDTLWSISEHFDPKEEDFCSFHQCWASVTSHLLVMFVQLLHILSSAGKNILKKNLRGSIQKKDERKTSFFWFGCVPGDHVEIWQIFICGRNKDGFAFNSPDQTLLWMKNKVVTNTGAWGSVHVCFYFLDQWLPLLSLPLYPLKLIASVGITLQWLLAEIRLIQFQE